MSLVKVTESELTLDTLPENPNATTNTTSIATANNRRLVLIDSDLPRQKGYVTMLRLCFRPAGFKFVSRARSTLLGPSGLCRRNRFHFPVCLVIVIGRFGGARLKAINRANNL